MAAGANMLQIFTGGVKILFQKQRVVFEDHGTELRIHSALRPAIWPKVVYACNVRLETLSVGSPVLLDWVLRMTKDVGTKEEAPAWIREPGC